LVSEIMLQQTQVDRVIPKYRQFLRRYPTIRRLARARPEEVRRIWYPLGYNIRPLRLWAIARETVARYGGRLPDDAAALQRLPGIGRYTAGAVLSFAYGRDAAVLDTNVRRVLGRVFLGPRLTWSESAMPLIIEVAAALVRDEAGRYLITQRRSGSHLAGLWEFPGGKREVGESPEAALRRELIEELSATFTVGEKLDTVT